MDGASVSSEDQSPEGVVELATLTIRTVGEPDCTVELRGELDIAGAPRLAEELARIELRDPSRITIDLSGLEFLDSTGIRVFLTAHERAEGNGTRLVFVRGNGAVARTLEVTGVAERIRFID